MQRATFGQFTFRFPASWHAVDATFNTGAVFAPMGWVTNRAPGLQCTPDPANGGHVSCHAPVERLGAGDLLVSFAESGAPLGPFHANSTLGGRPAQRRSVADAQCGPPGVDLVVRENAMYLRITSCFGPDPGAAPAQVRQMLATARFNG